MARARRRRKQSSWERAKRSSWLLLTVVPFGLLGWGAFVYAGINARRPRWTAFGAFYFACLVAGAVVAEVDEGVLDTAARVTLWALWGVMFVHALVIRRSYLERMELFEGGRFDAAEDDLLARDEARRLALKHPRRAVELGVGRPDLDDAFDAGLVDLNNAGVAAIEQLPGVTRELAEHIVSVREDIDGFESLADAGHVLDLPAPLVDRIRRHVIVLPRGFAR